MHTILASTLIGGLYLAVLFALCFGTVVGGKLLRRYLRERKKPPAALLTRRGRFNPKIYESAIFQAT